MTRRPPNTSTSTGKTWDTIHPTDIRYSRIWQRWSTTSRSMRSAPKRAGELAQIGIEKGEPFQPDDRMKSILNEAAQVGKFHGLRDLQRAAGRLWQKNPRPGFWHLMIPSYPEFIDDMGRPLIDDMVRMAWFATGRAIAMRGEKPGVGSAYTWAYREYQRRLDRPQAHLPASIARSDTRQRLLVGCGLRPVDPFDAGQRTRVPQSQLLFTGC